MDEGLNFQPEAHLIDELRSLLVQINGQKEVLGSLIVGHDGTVIAHNVSNEIDFETVGISSLGIYMHSDHVASRLLHNQIEQVLLRTTQGYTIISDFGAGILVVLTDSDFIFSNSANHDFTPLKSKHRIE